SRIRDSRRTHRYRAAVRAGARERPRRRGAAAAIEWLRKARSIGVARSTQMAVRAGHARRRPGRAMEADTDQVRAHGEQQLAHNVGAAPRRAVPSSLQSMNLYKTLLWTNRAVIVDWRGLRAEAQRDIAIARSAAR